MGRTVAAADALVGIELPYILLAMPAPVQSKRPVPAIATTPDTRAASIRKPRRPSLRFVSAMVLTRRVTDLRYRDWKSWHWESAGEGGMSPKRRNCHRGLRRYNPRRLSVCVSSSAPTFRPVRPVPTTAPGRRRTRAASVHRTGMSSCFHLQFLIPVLPFPSKIRTLPALRSSTSMRPRLSAATSTAVNSWSASP